MQVGIFCKAPIPGRTKTRLIPALGPEKAAQLSESFLLDTLHNLRNLPSKGIELSLWSAGPEHKDFLEELASRYSAKFYMQCEGNLGDRMTHALQTLCEDDMVRGDKGGSPSKPSPRPASLLGADAPTLPLSVLEQALTMLTQEPDTLALGPAADGGYYLIGCNVQLQDGFLNGVRWSGPHTYTDTLLCAEKAKLQVQSLLPWYDVDSAADLRLLRLELNLPGLGEQSIDAKHTRKTLFG